MADYTLSAKVTADTSNFKSGMDDLNNRMSGLSDRAKSLGKKVGDFGKSAVNAGAKVTAMTLPIALMGKTMLDTGMTFDSTMSEVKAISGATGNEFEILKNKAKDMGATTQFSATESAEALTYMARHTWPVAEKSAA